MINAARRAREHTGLKVAEVHHVVGDMEWWVVQHHKLLRVLALVTVAVVLECDRHPKPFCFSIAWISCFMATVSTAIPPQSYQETICTLLPKRAFTCASSPMSSSTKWPAQSGRSGPLACTAWPGGFKGTSPKQGAAAGRRLTDAQRTRFMLDP